MMKRNDAFKLLKQKISNQNLLKHSLATEVFMKFLAKNFNENEEKWALVGLLHDIDYMETSDEPNKHGLISAEMLNNLNFPKDIVYAVKVHNEVHRLPRKSKMDKALYAVDPLTGLIVACVLVSPKKKLKSIDVSFVVKRFNEKAFAKGACRTQIATCSELNFTLEEFIDIGLRAMCSIDDELEL